MSDRLKRILFIVFFLLFCVGVGFTLYFVFFRGALPPSGPSSTTSTEEGSGALPGAGPAQPGVPTTPVTSGGLPIAPSVPGAGIAPGAEQAQTTLLRDGVTQDVSPSADGQGARYYNPDDGKFYHVTSDGVSVALSDQSFPNIEQVTWGNSSDQAILTFPDGTKIHYNFQTKQQDTLPAHWDGFNFSPDDHEIVAKSVALSPGSRYLITSDPEGKNPQAVEPLGENDDKTFPVWTPNNQIIAYAEVGEAQGLDRQEVILVGKNHENFRALQVEGRGFVPLWSPDGTKVLYSIWNGASDYRPELWVSGGNPQNMNQDRAQIGIQTWADKCVWADAATVYCAVPDSLPSGAGIQRDLFVNIPDSFYQINVNTGSKTYIGRPEGVTGVRNLVITDDKDHLLFTDTQTGKLFDFKIP